MKNTLIQLFILIPSLCFSQNWQWVKQAGGNASQSYDFGNVITDGSNFYLYGTFSGAMYLQTDTFNGTNGNSDFFIIKYDNNGNELWAKEFGGFNGTNESEAMSAVYDTNSNCIYLAGSFVGIMQLDTITLVANGYGSNFLAKLNSNGSFLWAKRAWTRNNIIWPAYEGGPGLYLSQDGIIYINTSLIDTSYFDTIQVEPGGCFAKFDADGNCFYARNYFNLETGTQGGGGISFLKHSKDLIFAGSFKMTFSIDTATLISNGDYDAFVARADSNGNIAWIKHFGFGGVDYITDVFIDNDDYLYISGGFEDSINIDNNMLYNATHDMFILKFDSSGNHIWLKQTFTTGSILGIRNVIGDVDGNIYMAGTFSGSASFGTYNVTTINMSDMFLTRYSSNGDCLGVKHFGKAYASSVVINNVGNPVVAGGFANTVTIGSQILNSIGPWDIYMAKCDIFTGIEEERRTENHNLIIYANPNAGKCNITVPDDFVNEKNLTLSIYDNTGKMIQQKTLVMNEGKIKVNLEQEAKGVYNVTLSSNKKSYSGRIVFE